MEEVTVILEGVEYVFEFDTAPTEEEINTAMETIGGRTKRR